MRRREFMTLMGGAAMWPLPAGAQARPKVGFLYPGLSTVAAGRLSAFREGLRASGWKDEQVEVITRYANGEASRNAGLAAELIAQHVDILVPISAGPLEAMHRATASIPIVAFDLETDPVAESLVTSLSRPGGNITGVFFDFPDFSTKWIELLKETLPGLAKVVVLQDPASPSPQLKGVNAAADLFGVKLELLEVRTLTELDSVFRAVSERRPDAVLLLSSPLFGTNPKRVADLTAQYALPAITLFPEFARSGGLMAYGVNLLDAFRQTGGMAGKVLNGANPLDLPVERPVKFELVVNLKTARSLGITVPISVLLRADEVIE
jgi:putative ABC transport system substrate-binding protein